MNLTSRSDIKQPPGGLFLPLESRHWLKLLSECMGLRAVCRSMNVSADGVLDWIVKAANHVNEVSAYLKSEMHLTQCQIDEFWSFIPAIREEKSY
jgi:hypothetical protein